jgi:hypothetical protein
VVPADSPGGPDDWFVTGLIPLQTRLYRYIAGLVPVCADAEDLFQESLLTAWQERIRSDFSRDMFAWRCGIARNHSHHTNPRETGWNFQRAEWGKAIYHPTENLPRKSPLETVAPAP